MAKRTGRPTYTTPKVASAIQAMIDALSEEYGIDFAYSVSGRGYILACSNSVNGVIPPKAKG